MGTFSLSLPYPPVTGNHAVRHTAGGGHYRAPAYERWRGEVRRIVAEAGMAALKLAGPLELRLDIVPPDRRARDADNVRKVVGDALTAAGLLADDSNKVLPSERFEWHPPDHGGAVHVTLREVQR